MGGMTAPTLTDRAALARNRKRAKTDALFLHDTIADELHDRLGEVNRTFKSIGIVTGFPDHWAQHFPDATIVADDDTLALQPQSYDLILHVMALHWANDPVGQLVQCRHALKPDGLLLCSLLGGQTLNELRTSLAQAEANITGGLSPRIAPMGEIRDLGALLQRAGFALPVADGTPLKVTYETPFHLMRELRHMGEGNALDARIKHPTRRGVLTEAAAIYQDSFADGDRIKATFEVITLTGWAPSEDQPKALRPGSATTRLADVLNTKETKI